MLNNNYLCYRALLLIGLIDLPCSILLPYMTLHAADRTARVSETMTRSAMSTQQRTESEPIRSIRRVVQIPQVVVINGKTG